jgi:hypothetical protein
LVIKALAIELYRAQQTVHKLQDQLADASPAERDVLRRSLRTARAECEQLRRLIDAKKQTPPFRTSFKKGPGF